MEHDLSFHLQSVVKEKNELVDFEGPLNLILILLQKNKIEIRDIKISDILDQYLAFLDGMEKMDLEITSEFIQMASYLLLIKTKEMLASTEEISELEVLMESLEQLRAKEILSSIKDAIPFISEKYKFGSLIFSKQPEQFTKEPSEYQYSHEPVELLEALKSVFMSTHEIPYDNSIIEKVMPQKITFSIRDKSRHIISRLRLRSVKLNDLYSECVTKSEIVATFISILELCSNGNIEISLCRDGSGYELSYTGGDIETIMEKLETDYE